MPKTALLQSLQSLNSRIQLSDYLKLSAGNKFILDSDDVSANMQEDRAAFEAWLLLAKASGYGHPFNCQLEWPVPAKKTLHYNRFQFRVRNFEKLFDWFKPSIISPTLNDYDIKGKYIVNKPQGHAETSPSPLEAKIEAAFEANGTGLLGSAVAGLSNPSFILGRQLPVGLFDGSVVGGKKVFNAGHSAIDLWGIDDSGLHLFELKTPQNKKMGAVSELLFYAFFMNNVVKGTFQYNPAVSTASSTIPRIVTFNKLEQAIAKNFFSDKIIHAHLLLHEGRVHPGIEAKNFSVLQLLNDAFAEKQIPIRMGVLLYKMTSSPKGLIITDVKKAF